MDLEAIHERNRALVAAACRRPLTEREAEAALRALYAEGDDDEC